MSGIIGLLLTSPPAGGAGALYWRILITSQYNLGQEIGVGSIDFRSEIGGADLTAAAEASTRAFSSSEYSSTYRDDLGFDDSLTGDFEGWYTQDSVSLPEHIGWEFAEPQSIVEVEFRNLNNSYGLIKDFDVQHSDDGSIWVTKWSDTNPSNATGYTFTSSDPA